MVWEQQTHTEGTEWDAEAEREPQHPPSALRLAALPPGGCGPRSRASLLTSPPYLGLTCASPLLATRRALTNPSSGPAWEVTRFEVATPTSLRSQLPTIHTGGFRLGWGTPNDLKMGTFLGLENSCCSNNPTLFPGNHPSPVGSDGV